MKFSLTHMLLLLGLAWVGNCQADDWFAQQQKHFASFSEEKDKSYQRYLEQRDREFSQWLRRQWREYEQFKGDIRDPTPKPVRQPSVDPAPKKHSAGKLASGVGKTKTESTTGWKLSQQNDVVRKFTYLGHNVAIKLAPSLASVHIETATQEHLAEAWEQLATSNYSPTLESIGQLRQELSLSDWAMSRLVLQLSRHVHTNVDDQVLLSWFLLTRLGYRVRTGIIGQNLVLLFSPQQKVYALPYYRIDGRRYHPLMGNTSGNLATHQGEYNDNAASLDLSFATTIKPDRNIQKRQLLWQGQGVTVEYNRNLIELYSTHPQIDLRYYFLAHPGPATTNSFKKALLPKLRGKSEVQQVNLLLSLVQQSIQYQRDDKQFGAENYLLPEETIHYSGADCEDRAVLFAWLIRELVGLQVVGLNYPGHVSLAVALAKPQGDMENSISYQGNVYWPADPTYIDANLGQVMLQYRNIQPKIIDISISKIETARNR